jgi:hypothetical protein
MLTRNSRWEFSSRSTRSFIGTRKHSPRRRNVSTSWIPMPASTTVVPPKPTANCGQGANPAAAATLQSTATTDKLRRHPSVSR